MRELLLTVSKKKEKKRPSEQIFIQDCGIFSAEIVVLVGTTKKKAIEYCKKHDFRTEVTKQVAAEGLWKDFGVGRFSFNTEAHSLVLLLRYYEDTWQFWETLIHELNHVVYRIADLKTFKDEEEGQAYLQEYLFRSIRRKLMGLES